MRSPSHPAGHRLPQPPRCPSPFPWAVLPFLCLVVGAASLATAALIIHPLLFPGGRLCHQEEPRKVQARADPCPCSQASALSSPPVELRLISGFACLTTVSASHATVTGAALILPCKHSQLYWPLTQGVHTHSLPSRVRALVVSLLPVLEFRSYSLEIVPGQGAGAFLRHTVNTFKLLLGQLSQCSPPVFSPTDFSPSPGQRSPLSAPDSEQ